MKPAVRSTVRCLATAMAGLLALSATATAQTPPFRNPDLPADERITNLLSLMTPDEKVQAVGGFVSGVPRLGVPSFGMSEGIHGLVQRGMPERNVPPITTTQFPQPPGMGSSWNPDLVRRAGGVQGSRGALHHAERQVQVPHADGLGPAGRPRARPPLGPRRGGLRRGPVLQRCHGDGVRPRHPGERPEVLAGRPAAEALPRELERERAHVVELPVRRAALLGVLLGAVPHGVPGRGGQRGDGLLQRLERHAHAPPSRPARGADRPVGRAGHFERRRRRPEPLGGSQGRPGSEGRRGRRAEGGNQPVPGPGPRGAARRTEGRPGDGGGPRRGAAAEVPRLAQARAARPAGDRPVREQASRRPGAVGQPGAPRHLEDDGPRVDRAAEERRRRRSRFARAR